MTNPPPKHYPSGTFEPWNVIEAWGLGYNLGNVLKYVSRAGKKGPALDDLVKARNYLDRQIDLEAERVVAPTNTPHSNWRDCDCAVCKHMRDVMIAVGW